MLLEHQVEGIRVDCLLKLSFVKILFPSLIRSDLPGYLADSEADGVCVINYYHKQFKHAAKKRYFLDDTDYLYFHSYMSDYFLGTYGGGILKPFRYTEIQKHTFNLKTKDDNKDRQVLQFLFVHD